MANQTSTEIEENRNQKLNDILQILAKVITPETNTTRTEIGFRQSLLIIVNFWKNLITAVLREAGYWEKISFIGIGVFMILSIGFAVIINIIKNSNEVPDKWLIRVALVCIFLIIPPLLSFIALNARRTWKSPSLYTRVRLEKSMNEAIDDHLTIKDLCEKSDQQALKSAEIQIKFLIEAIQLQEKINSNFLPILALGSVVLSIYILGIPAQSLEGNKFLYGAVTGLPGIVALILLIFKLTIESSLQSQILKYKRCVSLLERAQASINNNENGI